MTENDRARNLHSHLEEHCQSPEFQKRVAKANDVVQDVAREAMDNIDEMLSSPAPSAADLLSQLEENQEPPKATGATKPFGKKEWLFYAMQLVEEYPDWPDSKIAGHPSVNKNPGTLSRNKTYQQAAAMARGSKEQIKPGYRIHNPETGSSDYEAIDGTADPADMNWDD